MKDKNLESCQRPLRKCYQEGLHVGLLLIQPFLFSIHKTVTLDYHLNNSHRNQSSSLFTSIKKEGIRRVLSTQLDMMILSVGDGASLAIGNSYAQAPTLTNTPSPKPETLSQARALTLQQMTHQYTSLSLEQLTQ